MFSGVIIKFLNCPVIKEPRLLFRDCGGFGCAGGLKQMFLMGKDMHNLHNVLLERTGFLNSELNSKPCLSSDKNELVNEQRLSDEGTEPGVAPGFGRISFSLFNFDYKNSLTYNWDSSLAQLTKSS